MKSELYKGGTVFFLPGQDGEVAELEVLVDGGPLCVAGVWDWGRKRLAQGLYRIYFKRFAIHFGPFYANLSTAERDMRKALKIQPGLWDTQDIGWYARQKWLHQWIEKNLGKAEWLIGGVWMKD
jgi:hypothetical protein